MQKHNNRIIKDGQVVADSWQLLRVDSDNNLDSVDTSASNIIVSLEQLQADEALQQRSDVGVWIHNDTDLGSVSELLVTRPIVAIDFPVFMDGRGFSLARLLRERYHYQGEIRAVGHVIRDQLCYLRRCGFNTFHFSDDSIDLEAAVDSLSDFSEAYQTAVDLPEPLFRRRA